jgi:DNA polymerase III alpha subunit
MVFYGPSQLVQDARRHGVEVRAADVQHSDWDARSKRAMLTMQAVKTANAISRRCAWACA